MKNASRGSRLQVRTSQFATECGKCQFVRSNRGSTLIEYALVLGALACAVMAGLYFCDDLGIPVFGHLAGSLGADTQPSTGEVGLNKHVVQVAESAARSEWISHAYRTPARPAIAFLLAAILIVVFWKFTRRRRTSTSSAEGESTREHAEDRLHIKRQVLWKSILDDPRLLFKNSVEVRHLMTRDVSVVARHTQSDEIRRLMTEKHMHHVLVCNSDGRLLGVVSDRDLRGEAAEAAVRVMTAEPMVVRPDTTASAAIALMLEHQISCLPVVHEEQVCGILTRTDLLLSLQCMLQWWLRFAQTLARTAECADKIDAVQETSGRYLSEQRTRLESLLQFLANRESSLLQRNQVEFEEQARMFLDTAGELIAMQTFEGDRLSDMASDLLELTRS